MTNLPCQACGHPDTRVIDVRYRADLIAIRRRRRCLSCSSTFGTDEHYEGTLELAKLLVRRLEARP